mgnify:CR=1 FL=1
MKRKYILIAMLIVTILITAAFSANDGNSGTFAIGEDLRVKEDETIDDSINVLFGDVVIDGRVDGDVAVIFGDVVIKGSVDGNVVAVFGDISVGDQGIVKGSAAAVMGKVKRSPGSIIEGEIASVEGPFNVGRADILPLMAVSSIISLVIFYGLSAVLLVIMPDRMSYMSQSTSFKIWRRFGIGIAAYLLFIPAIVVLAITIIGLFLIPFFIAGFLITAFIGMTALKITLGRRITGSLEGRGAPYIYLLVGSILISVLPFVPVVGWLVYLFAASVGLGVVLDTRFGKPKARVI